MAQGLPNLARQVDLKNPQLDPVVHQTAIEELTEAGIKVNELPVFLRNCGEVPTSAIGTLAGWSFKRAWYYWVASGPGIPPEKAEEFHQKWGKEVRVEGHCGCPSPLDYCEGFAVGSYHIDTQRGLNAFAQLLLSIHKPRKV